MADLEIEEYELEEGMEWRFELEEGEAIALRVLSDTPIFINFQEIPPDTWYPIHGELKASIWSPGPYGKIEVSSSPSTSYSSTSSTFPYILSLHLALERYRIIARRTIKERKALPLHDADSRDEIGPRLMVIGPKESGKSTVVKSLVNLATGSGMGWCVGVAGLDPGNPPHLLPGSVSLSTPIQPLPSHYPSHSLGPSPTTAPSNTLSSDISTLGWWIGTSQLGTSSGASGKTSFPLWRKIVDAMAWSWSEKMARDENCRAAGLIVDTPSAFILPNLGALKGDKSKFNILRHAVQAFESKSTFRSLPLGILTSIVLRTVDCLLVIGHEKITVEMEKIFKPLGVTILRVPKSSGTVELDEGYRNRIQGQQMRSYFYGEPTLPPSLSSLPGRTVALETALHPYSFMIGWDDLEIYRVGEDAAAPSSALPIGKQRILSATRLTKVNPASSASVHKLNNAVLGLVLVSDTDKRTDLPERDSILSVKTEDVKPPAEDGAVKEEEGGEEEDDEEIEQEPIWKEEIGWREVVGFITIASIDVAKRKYTVLSPSPGKLPSKIAIAGTVEWNEEDS